MQVIYEACLTGCCAVGHHLSAHTPHGHDSLAVSVSLGVDRPMHVQLAGGDSGWVGHGRAVPRVGLWALVEEPTRDHGDDAPSEDRRHGALLAVLRGALDDAFYASI